MTVFAAYEYMGGCKLMDTTSHADEEDILLMKCLRHISTSTSFVRLVVEVPSDYD